jgi:signal transduction histidine kinase
MFQQVFFNLFVNAIKYYDPADRFRVEVKIGIEGEARKPIAYLIEIEDWGIGLDSGDDKGEGLFLPGVRGKHTSQYRDVSGMGIGLAIVRAVVNAHCGTVGFSSPRKPTRVTIRLPGALRHMSPRLIQAQGP